MQNIDFYSGSHARELSPQFEKSDPEYFPRMSGIYTRDQEKAKKRASRVIFLISALCIICFTTGLAIGIKFAGGGKTPIVDDATYNAMNSLSKKVSSLVKTRSAEAATRQSRFPMEKYPFAIKVGKSYKEKDARAIASYLSKKGHTVILSRASLKGYFRVYTGPFESINKARKTLKKLDSYTHYSISSSSRIVKRK